MGVLALIKGSTKSWEIVRGIILTKSPVIATLNYSRQWATVLEQLEVIIDSNFSVFCHYDTTEIVIEIVALVL